MDTVTRAEYLHLLARMITTQDLLARVLLRSSAHEDLRESLTTFVAQAREQVERASFAEDLPPEERATLGEQVLADWATWRMLLIGPELTAI